MVTYSLFQSQTPITKIEVALNGVVVTPTLNGTTDLRTVGSNRFTLPITAGIYELTMTASDVNGCSATVDRPMPIVVTN